MVWNLQSQVHLTVEARQCVKSKTYIEYLVILPTKGQLTDNVHFSEMELDVAHNTYE